MIDSNLILKRIEIEIQSAVLKAAEPAIQQAIIEAEKTIRAKAAEIAMTYAQKSYEVRSDRNVINIRIGLNGNEINS